MIRFRQAAAVVLMFVTTTCFAQPSGYIGATLGSSDVDYPGYDNALALQLCGDVKETENFGAELSYTYLGKFELAVDSDDYVEVYGLEVTALGKLPISETVSLFGEAGIYFWTADAVVADYFIVGTDDGSELTYGFGLTAELVNNIDFVAGYQVYPEISGADIELIYGGMTFNFR